MSKPLVSIIIPVYNSEKYLQKSIESVLNQTFSSFELLLVNDGSTDGSRNICDYFAAKDIRISVFHRQNCGVSASRNFGIENAKCKYIGFIDSDDWVENTYLEHLLKDSGDAELLAAGYSEQTDKSAWTEYLPDSEAFENEQIKSFLEKHISSCIGHAPWGKLFLKTIIDKNALRFEPDFAYGEDTLFCIRYLKKITSIRVNRSADYYWRFVKTSLSRVNRIGDIEAWNSFISTYRMEFLPIMEKFGFPVILEQHLADRYFNIFSKTVETLCVAKTDYLQRRAMLPAACAKLDEFCSDYAKIACRYGLGGKLLMAMYKSKNYEFYYNVLKIFYTLKRLIK